jgi:DnaJ-class molecular chaperone
MIKCDRCQGDKVIIGMGAMKEKCTNCKGKGFVEEVVKTKKKD